MNHQDSREVPTLSLPRTVEMAAVARQYVATMLAEMEGLPAERAQDTAAQAERNAEMLVEAATART